MRRMNHRISVALELFPMSMEGTTCQTFFLFAAKVGAEQSWVSRLDIGLRRIGGNSILTLGPFANVDVHLPNGMTSCQTLQSSLPITLYMAYSGQNAIMAKNSAVFRFTFRSVFSPRAYGIVVVVFHFDSDGSKAKKWRPARVAHCWTGRRAGEEGFVLLEFGGARTLWTIGGLQYVVASRSSINLAPMKGPHQLYPTKCLRRRDRCFVRERSFISRQ